MGNPSKLNGERKGPGCRRLGNAKGGGKRWFQDMTGGLLR
jgi:hypothetical protein